ncbi:hypothetical protein JVT61DRAFT_10754 [Boletus reticuloceps]|uniref:Uncharacterized protein n=1 Tax=Boletus reticuloceps TaxID=495285 RepID=A0A8I3A587_9AGAM|nr:hypothetical protein JVT61DRAFT_10754 [Boletus reticuloceps]
METTPQCPLQRHSNSFLDAFHGAISFHYSPPALPSTSDLSGSSRRSLATISIPYSSIDSTSEWSDNILTANFLRLLPAPSNVSATSPTAASNSPSPSTLQPRMDPPRLDIFPPCLHHLNALRTPPRPLLRNLSLRLQPRAHISLLPAAFPRLRHFRSVLSSPQLTSDFVSSRPIESVSTSLYPGDVTSSLDALLLSTRPHRLTSGC